MPKTLACSPLKPAPMPQRFARSLLLSYADSPAQRSYVLPTDDTSDADEDDDELDIRAASPTEAPDVGFSQNPDPDAEVDGAGEDGDNRASARRNSWTNGSTAEARRSRSSVALRTLQSARQALVNAKRRSFELGERSVSATFHQLRSCSLSSMRFSDNSDLDNATSATDNNDSESPSSLAADSNISISSNHEQLLEEQEQEHTESEQPEQEEIKQLKQQQQHPTKKKRRIRTASYQSALTKYLPVIFTRSTSSRSEMAEEGDSGLNSNSSNSASSDNNRESAEEEDQNSKASTSDTEDNINKQETTTAPISSSNSISNKVRRLAKWPLRQRQEHNEELRDNQSEHEHEAEKSTTAA